MASPAWHSTEVDEVLSQLQAVVTGLTTAEVQKRLAEYGTNSLPEKTSPFVAAYVTGAVCRFYDCGVADRRIYFGFIGEPQDTIAILVIVLLNAIIGVVQEYRAERAMVALKQMAAAHLALRFVFRLVSIESAKLDFCQQNSICAR